MIYSLQSPHQSRAALGGVNDNIVVYDDCVGTNCLWRIIGLLWENNAPAALHTVGGKTGAPTRGAYIFFVLPCGRVWRRSALHTACGCLWENNAPAALHKALGKPMAPTRGAYMLFMFFAFCVLFFGDVNVLLLPVWF